MQLSSLFTLFFTLFALGLTVVAAPIPATPVEERSFNLSGRVVDRRVGRALKHFKIQRPTPVVVARNGYDNNNHDNNGNSYDNGNDKPYKGVGGYGGGADGGQTRTKDNNGYGGDNNGGYGGGNGGYGGGNGGNGGGNGGYGGGNGGYGGDNNGHGGDNNGHSGDNNGHGGEGGPYGSGGGNNTPKPPKPSSWPTTYGYNSGH